MECPKCSLINPDSALRCDCGYDFQYSKIDLREGFKFCQGCGTRNSLSAQFCQGCGARYDGAEPPPVTKAGKSSPLKVLGTLILCVFGCCIVSSILGPLRGDRTASSTVTTTESSQTSTSSTTAEDEKIIQNEFGKTTVRGSGGKITSIRIDAFTKSQKEKLMLMLVYLEAPEFAAERACSMVLTFGG